MDNISGLTITEHQKSKRIIDIQIENEILDKLIFPFNKFDITACLLYTSPSPRDAHESRMPSSA